MKSQTTVGSWTINMPSQTILYAKTDDEIELKDCRTCAGMLDWIFQLQEKTWISDKDMRDFLKIMNQVFYPQGLMCSFGTDHTQNRKGPLKENKDGHLI